MEKYFTNGFVDSFRYKNPDKKDAYSWWSYRAGARKNNKGWRIDYIATTESLQPNIAQAAIFAEAVHSDHCPIFCMLSF
jgi:exodeoxyribonuclease-3